MTLYYEYPNFRTALLDAIKHEQEQIRHAREMIINLSGQDEYIEIRDRYNETAIAHLEHLSLLTFLYNAIYPYIKI